jgi:DnaJ-class molecular chaperone
MTVQTVCPKCAGLGTYSLAADLKPAAIPAESPETQCENCKGTGFIEDRNYAVNRTCPHCEDPEAWLMPPLGYYSEYQCRNCGTYRISGTMEELIENGTVNPRAGRFEERGGYRWLVK